MMSLTSSDPKYDVALSFAGENRDYVEKVANLLLSDGVKVFYDKHEEVDLWGKDLYSHLKDVYEKQATFTVMFISKDYKDKVWTNHERRAAQERALLKTNKEYILPAFFDETIDIPGLARTTGHISLAEKTPEQLANLIVEKLVSAGVDLPKRFSYSDSAKADVDFPMPKGRTVTKIINDLKSHTWPVQSPAIKAIFDLDWSALTPDEIFVLGRNIYQCADGGENRAKAILTNLRSELAKLPEEAALHLLNGMFFEVYFNKEGDLRSRQKGKYLGELLVLQLVKKFAPSISFIRRELEPYRARLPFLPSLAPEPVRFELAVQISVVALVSNLKLNGRELLLKGEPNDQFWKLSSGSFTLSELERTLSEAWSIPPNQIEIICNHKLDAKADFQLPKDHTIGWPQR